jgi:Dolichyl-phosphate-mannose-protein mannosyltransferase
VDAAPPGSSSSFFTAIVFFVVALGVFIPWIGVQEIWSKDEARTALIVREMLTTGDWSLPRLPGGAFSKKPPLYHWLAALVAATGLDARALRLPAAVAAAGTVALTYLFAAELATPAVGVLAASILIGSPSFFEWARIARMETLLALSFTLSLWGLGRWLRRGGRRHGLLFGLGIGLGVLSKGPAGLLPLIVAALAIGASRASRERVRELAPGLAAALALPLAWLVAAAATAPDLLRYARTFGPTIANELTQSGNAGLAIVEGLVVGFYPWVVLIPGALMLLLRRQAVWSPFIVVSLAWIVVVLVVFIVAVPARAVYFLPAYPALASLAAWGWHVAYGRERRWLYVPLAVGIAAVIVLGIVGAVQPITPQFSDNPLHLPAWLGLVAAGALLVTGAVALRLERKRASVAALVVLATGVVITLFALDVGARAPFYNEFYPMRAAAAQLERRIPPGASVGYTDANRGTALAANLRRPLTQLEPLALAAPAPRPRPAYLLLPQAQFDTARTSWPLEYVDELRVHGIRYVLARITER